MEDGEAAVLLEGAFGGWGKVPYCPQRDPAGRA